MATYLTQLLAGNQIQGDEHIEKVTNNQKKNKKNSILNFAKAKKRDLLGI